MASVSKPPNFSQYSNYISSIPKNLPEVTNLSPNTKLGFHDYGTTPTVKGALNFARDNAIATAMPFYKQLLKEEQKQRPFKAELFIRMLAPVLLMLGIVLSFYSLYSALTKSTAFGLQSVIIDSTSAQITDNNSYQFKVDTSTNLQQWNIRQGEFGRQQSATLTFPEPSLMKTNALVFFRNASIETINHLSNPYSINPSSSIPLLTVKVPGLTNKTYERRTGDVFIAAKDPLGVQRWYPALMMSGVY